VLVVAGMTTLNLTAL